jgi:ATP:cob(I)alamin adenosyltransferase
MSVTTGSGDKGDTGLWSGERVSKASARVESYGAVDELNAFIGEAKHHVLTDLVREALQAVQRDLFKVAGQLATIGKTYDDPLGEEDAARLRFLTNQIEEELDLKGFVIPGSTSSSAKLDICRTVARRAERRAVRLKKEEEVPAPVIVYLNRLSDLLFVLARYEEHKLGKIEYK